MNFHFLHLLATLVGNWAHRNLLVKFHRRTNPVKICIRLSIERVALAVPVRDCSDDYYYAWIFPDCFRCNFFGENVWLAASWFCIYSFENNWAFAKYFNFWKHLIKYLFKNLIEFTFSYAKKSLQFLTEHWSYCVSSARGFLANWIICDKINQPLPLGDFYHWQLVNITTHTKIHSVTPADIAYACKTD